MEQAAEMSAPVVVAKGRGPIAARIRAIARQFDVPIVENIPLAQAHPELSPRQIILFSHYGMKEKIYTANPVWLCATCNACMVWIKMR